MDLSRVFVAACGAGLLSSMVLAQTAPAQGRFIPGRVLVKFKPQVTESRAADVLASLQARSERELPNIGVHVVQLPAGANEQAVANPLKHRPDVAFAELDAVLPPADIVPNDPWYATSGAHLRDVSAPAAWSTTIGSPSVVIAVIDTGVDATHEDLASKLVPGWNIYANNSDTSDAYGHGTAVAGTAAAASNNGVGVASVCWLCSIMPVRISDGSGYASYSDAASAITWAADHGARVANLSYQMGDSSTVSSAAQYLWMKGGVLTVAAGNSGAFDSTADDPYILAVSAIDQSDVLEPFSNTGNNIDLAAPGCVFTTMRGGGYGTQCGTSFSAPMAAGVAALILSANPNLSASQVVSILQQNADDLGASGWDSSYGWGKVNAARAVTAALSVVSVSIDSPQNGATLSGAAAVQVSASAPAGVAAVSWYVDNALAGRNRAAPYTWTWDTTTAANGGHTLTVVATDTCGRQASNSSTVTVSNATADTTKPMATITSPANDATVSGNLTVSIAASDNVGVTAVDLLLDGVVVATDTAAPYSFKLTARNWTKGTHTLQARASDAAGNVGISAVVTVRK